MSLLQQRSVFSRKLHKPKEKVQNISSKLHRLNTPHVLRDGRHVKYIGRIYTRRRLSRPDDLKLLVKVM